MEKIDPKERWINWKEKVKSGIPDLSPANSEIIMQYLTDMEYGMNVAAARHGMFSNLKKNFLKSFQISNKRDLRSHMD
jgi:hypothetical protein